MPLPRWVLCPTIGPAYALAGNITAWHSLGHQQGHTSVPMCSDRKDPGLGYVGKDFRNVREQCLSCRVSQTHTAHTDPRKIKAEITGALHVECRGEDTGLCAAMALQLSSWGSEDVHFQ